MKKIFEELNERRMFVEEIDHDINLRNSDHFRNYWLHIIIISSAITVGILPLIDSTESSLIKSPDLAKLGLLLITIVCVSLIIYFQQVLSREKAVTYDQKEVHKNTFLMQQNILESAKREGKSEEYLRDLFERTKKASFDMEQEIIARHILDGKFSRIRLFVDRHFNQFIVTTFTVGIILTVLSFICD